MTVFYRSTMQPAISGEPVEPLTESEIEQLKDPERNPRNLELEKIAERNAERTHKAPEIRHEEAVKQFDYAYADVANNPVLLAHVVAERAQLIESAARNGETVDWAVELPKIGDKVRQKAGLPTGPEREHFEWIQEARQSRGKQ